MTRLRDGLVKRTALRVQQVNRTRVYSTQLQPCCFYAEAGSIGHCVLSVLTRSTARQCIQCRVR